MVQAENNSKSLPESLLKKEMIRRAKQSEQEIAAGKTIGAKQFNSDFQAWKKEKRQSIK